MDWRLMRSQRMDGVHKSLASAFGEEDGVLQHDLEALDRRRLLGASSGLPLGAVDRQHARLQLEIANQAIVYRKQKQFYGLWLTLYATWQTILTYLPRADITIESECHFVRLKFYNSMGNAGKMAGDRVH